MTQEEHNRAYTEGANNAWRGLLRLALETLGAKDPEAQHARWIIERGEAVQMLRMMCRELDASNDWPDDLHLADVIEKHLCRPIMERLENHT